MPETMDSKLLLGLFAWTSILILACTLGVNVKSNKLPIEYAELVLVLVFIAGTFFGWWSLRVVGG